MPGEKKILQDFRLKGKKKKRADAVQLYNKLYSYIHTDVKIVSTVYINTVDLPLS